MATPEDLAANADYIRMADQYVEVRKKIRAILDTTARGIVNAERWTDNMDRSLVEPTTTTTPTSSSLSTLLSV